MCPRCACVGVLAHVEACAGQLLELGAQHENWLEANRGELASISGDAAFWPG